MFSTTAPTFCNLVLSFILLNITFHHSTTNDALGLLLLTCFQNGNKWVLNCLLFVCFHFSQSPYTNDIKAYFAIFPDCTTSEYLQRKRTSVWKMYIIYSRNDLRISISSSSQGLHSKNWILFPIYRLRLAGAIPRCPGTAVNKKWKIYLCVHRAYIGKAAHIKAEFFANNIVTLANPSFRLLHDLKYQSTEKKIQHW